MRDPDFSKFPVLETQRLVLRALSQIDAPEILRLRSDIEVAALTGKAPFVGLADAIAYIHRIENLIHKNECIFWAVSYKDSPALIGAVCFWNFDIPNDTIEIGYELLPEFQRKGIMTEVLERVIKYVFDTMGVETIVAFPSVENSSSIKLLEKRGFRPAPGNFKHTHSDVPGMQTLILSNAV